MSPHINTRKKYGFTMKIARKFVDTESPMMGRMVEAYLEKKAGELGFTPPAHTGRMPSYKGGFVKEPEIGLHENVAVMDFVSIYPSIIVTYNISPDTLDEHGETEIPGEKWRFTKKKKGFIPLVIEDLIKHKNSSTGQEREFFKRLASSIYGTIGQPSSKWYCPECASSITAMGRWHITKLIKAAASCGRVVYSDTDSVFVVSDMETAENFVKDYDSKLPGIMKLKMQGYYDKLFIASKKKYALMSGREMTIKGFEAVRSDWCLLSKIAQKKILMLVMTGREKESMDIVRKAAQKLETGKASLKDVAITSVISKPINKYKTRTAHTTAAKILQKKGKKIEFGTEIRYVICRGKGSISDRAVPVSMMKGKKYDAGYYINNQLVPAALRVLEVFGFTEETVKNMLDNKSFG